MSLPQINRKIQVGAGTLDSSSLLETFSTTQGASPFPSMDETQRDNISNPKNGLIVYNTTSDKVNLYDGTSWADIAGASGSGDWTYTAKTANYTAAANDFVDGNASGGAFTVTLPTAASIAGKRIAVRKNESSLNAVTVDADGSETINGSLTFVLTIQDDIVYLVSDGTNWMITSRHIKPLLSSGTSGIKTLIANGDFALMSANSRTLKPGKYRLMPSLGTFLNSGGSPLYTFLLLAWYSANGADTGSQPASLGSSGSIVVDNSTLPADAGRFGGIVSGNDHYITTSEVIITVSASVAVYLVPLAVLSTAAFSRITVYPNVERIK